MIAVNINQLLQLIMSLKKKLRFTGSIISVVGNATLDIVELFEYTKSLIRLIMKSA